MSNRKYVIKSAVTFFGALLFLATKVLGADISPKGMRGKTFPNYEHEFVERALETIREFYKHDYQSPGVVMRYAGRSDEKFKRKSPDEKFRFMLDRGGDNPSFNLTAASNVTYKCELSAFRLYTGGQRDANFFDENDLGNFLSSCQTPKLTFTKTPFSDSMHYSPKGDIFPITGKFDCKITDGSFVHIEWWGKLSI